MAGLENLFAAEPTLPSVQTAKMPDNLAEWAEVITTKLRERYPEATRLSLSIEFRKKDEQSGTAIGAIHCREDQSQKEVLVPFIVRKFELSPLDIWMETKTQAVHPLTNDTFKEELFVHSPAEGLDARPADSAGQYFNDPSLWTTNYPPLQGRYSYASAGYPLLDQISDTIEKKDLERFKETLRKEAASLPRFDRNGHKEILQKLAKLHGVNTNNFAQSVIKLFPQGAVSIKREGPDKYSILSIADKLFDLAVTEQVNLSDCKKYLSKITPHVDNLINDIDTEGEKAVVVKAAPSKGVFLFDDIREKPEVANEFACYSVKTKTGLTLEGVVLPHVVNFAGKKQQVKLFISPSHSSFQDTVVGVKRPNGTAITTVLKPASARVGQTGTFVFIDDGKAIATVPVTIKCIEDYGPMTAVLLDGTKIKISRGYTDDPTSYEEKYPAKGKKSEKKFLDVHGMIEQRPNEYVIPRRMIWVPMEGFQEVSSSVDGWLSKEAATRMTPDPFTIQWTGVVYEVSGNGIEKKAMDERLVKVLLLNQGAPQEKIASILKRAKVHGRAKVYGLNRLGKKAEIIKEAEKTYQELTSICEGLKKNAAELTKVAAEIDDSSTVDVLLGLNFLNPENLSKFISYKPVFDKVLDYLAEITLASRLGLKDVPESAVVTALSHLQEIAEGLGKVEAGMKKPGTKTAAAKTTPKPLKSPEPKEPEMEMEPVVPAPANPSGGGENHFANGMVDGEMGTHLHLEKARKGGPQSLLAYMNGKRLSEQNKTTAQMQMGIPPKGMPKQKQPGK